MGKTGNIKTIETVYNGYRFRSRLEARWAVFYDALGIKYEYEPNGFDLGKAGWYLPDFWLPDYNYWIEVKPDEPRIESDDFRKIAALATILNQDVYIAIGQVWMPYNGDPYSGGDIANYHRPIHPGGSMASHSWWIECQVCSGLSIAVFGWYWYGQCHQRDKQTLISHWSDTPRLLRAYTIARQARFEHGEKPITSRILQRVSAY
jgi:hypothetical protein